MNKNIEFAKLGLVLFVHYGLFSVLGSGEWAKYTNNIPDIEYEKLAYLFNPKKNFLDEKCSFAKENGFNYIVFTARHHDGFSLYDTKDLNNYNLYQLYNSIQLNILYRPVCFPYFPCSYLHWTYYSNH